jgi:hypothetical protein
MDEIFCEVSMKLGLRERGGKTTGSTWMNRMNRIRKTS